MEYSTTNAHFADIFLVWSQLSLALAQQTDLRHLSGVPYLVYAPLFFPHILTGWTPLDTSETHLGDDNLLYAEIDILQLGIIVLMYLFK